MLGISDPVRDELHRNHRVAGLHRVDRSGAIQLVRVPVTVLLCLIIPIAVAVGLTDERRKVLLATFLDSKEADSILNHSLKNTMADPAGQLEIFLDDPDGIKDLDPSLIQNLKMALASLRRGMKSCRNRQTYISLVSGTYNSVRSAVTAHQFLSDVTMGRAVEVVETQLGEFQLDPVLMDLILDNAMANATKHGDPRGPNVRITVKGGPDGSTVFQVTNKAKPNSEVLTAEFVESMFSGEERDKHHRSNDLLSSGLGMQHTRRAALACGTDISLWQGGSVVTFQAVVPPSSGPPPSVDQDEEEDQVDVSAFPNGLHVCCIDDSKPTLRTLEISLPRHLGAAEVKTFGQNGPDDVPLFILFILWVADATGARSRIKQGHRYVEGVSPGNCSQLLAAVVALRTHVTNSSTTPDVVGGALFVGQLQQAADP